MIENNQLELDFPRVRGKKVTVDFDGGVVTSDAGLLLLRETERSVGIIDRLSKCIIDTRDSRYIDHTVRELMTQRAFQIACGYEDADDSDSLRHDPALKMACGRTPMSGEALGSQPTISRFENAVSRTTLYRMGIAFIDNFLDSYRRAPDKIIVDVDDAAYVLLHTLAEKGLRGTKLVKAQFDTIILKVLKIGARVVEGLSRIRVHLPTSCPSKDLYVKNHKNSMLGAT